MSASAASASGMSSDIALPSVQSVVGRFIQEELPFIFYAVNTVVKRFSLEALIFANSILNHRY